MTALARQESDVSSGKSAGASAKDLGWPSSVRQRVAARKRSSSTLCRWPATASDIGALGRDSRVHRGCLPLRPLVIRTVLHLEDHRRKFAVEMLARLALASGWRISRKIATSRRLDLDVFHFSDEKIFRVDVVAPGHGFTIFLWKTGAT